MKKIVLRTGLSALILLTIAATTNVAGVAAVSASDWKSGRIIDDSVFTNKNDMTIEQVQQFLNSKVPVCDAHGQKSYAGTSRAQYGASRGNPIPFTCLKDYHEVPKTQPGAGLPASNYGGQPIPAGAKSAAHLIWEAAQVYDISPRVLLVTLHKESGLITDDWPFKSQFTYAMGSHCPDSTGCDPNYGGFSLQMREAAAMFRGYINNMQQSWWPYRRPFQNNVIAYSPNGACGGSDVFIESKATAALYTYTPYQPNQAALNAGYGTGDACSAYGNRNFWLFFSDWFGSTIDRTFQLAISDDGSPTQYVLYNNLKQAIPNTDIKTAWGLQNQPLNKVSAAYLSTLVNGPPLDVLFRVNGSTTVFLADNGNKYHIGSPDMLKAWGLDGRVISNVTTGLGNTPQDTGALSYIIRRVDTTAVYMVDGTNGSNQPVIRQYANGDVLTAIEGDTPKIINVSAMRFDAMNDAIGSAINTTKAAYGGNEYQMLAGQRMPQPISIAPLYPGVATTISAATFGRLLPTAPATPLIRSNASPNVYLMDSGTKKLVTDPDILKSWTPQGQHVNVVNNGFVNLIPTNSNVNSYIAAGSTRYIMANGSKVTIPAELTNSYSGNTKGTNTVSPTLEALFPAANTVASAFVKSSTSDRLYILDNSSILHALPSPAEAEAWGVTPGNITTVPPAALASFTQGDTAKLFVSDGTVEYVLNKGKKLTLDAGAKEEWGLGNTSPQTYNDGTLNRISTGDALATEAKDQYGYYLVRDGKAYYTVDPHIAGVWNIQDATADYQALFTRLVPVEMLTRFVVSSTDANAVYVVDSASWYGLSATHQANFGVANQPKITLNPNNAPHPTATWNGVVVKDSTNTFFVIDGGGKRTFNHPVILNHWTNNQSLSVQNVSQAFVNLLPNKGPIERAVKGGGPEIYSAENATKRWITSPSTFNQHFAPYAQVSDALLQAMPTGSNIP